ncbi:activator of Hsp90 ATPase, putative [Hepatocystis sp. ex Piliocolobus tephrosceles]|nr:activator of Hsp90 ATPase, putative [Hepatocystis sp. ex Piliocolobus tephrosceles]
MSFELEQEFYVPPVILFNAFTDAQVLTRLSRGALAEVELKVGGDFSMFSKSIYGKFIKIDNPNEIIQTWKFCDWNENDYSQVTINFIPIKENHTLIKLKHENIPLKNKYNEGGVLERCKHGWTENIFRSIELVLGYPKKK